jgi:hypothetical protein
MKSRSWKKRWTAKLMAFLTLATAPKVLVLGLRWAMVRRNSKEWRFF